MKDSRSVFAIDQHVAGTTSRVFLEFVNWPPVHLFKPVGTLSQQLVGKMAVKDHLCTSPPQHRDTCRYLVANDNIKSVLWISKITARKEKESHV